MLFFYIFEQWVLTWTQAEMFLCMELEATGKTYKNKELTFLWTPTKKKPGFPPEVKKKFSLLKCSYNIFVAADGYPFPLSSQQWVSSSRKTLAAAFLIVLMYLSLSLVHNLHGEGPLPFLPCEWCFPSGVFSEKSNYVFWVVQRTINAVNSSPQASWTIPADLCRHHRPILNIPEVTFTIGLATWYVVW